VVVVVVGSVVVVVVGGHDVVVGSVTKTMLHLQFKPATAALCCINVKTSKKNLHKTLKTLKSV